MSRHFAVPALLVAAFALLMTGAPVMAEQTEPTSGVSPSAATTSEPALRGTLKINGQTFSNLQPVSSQLGGLDAATNITDNNGIDEVYVKDAQGRLYIAYGYYNNLDTTLKRGYRGSVGGSMVEVVHVNNELNTGSEGFSTGIDDLKGLFTPLVTEHFGKLLTGLGIGSAAVIGRQLLAHPLAGEGLAAAVRAALPILGSVALRASIWGTVAAASWPVLKALWNLGKKLYLERQKDNPHTIAMVTAENAAQLEAPVVIGADQRREGTGRDLANEVLRRAEFPAPVASAPTTGVDRSVTPAATTPQVTGTPNPGPRAPRLGGSNDDLYGDLRNR